MKNKKSFFLRLTIGLIILFFLFSRVGLEGFSKAFSNIVPIFLPIVFLLLLAQLVMGALNLWLIIRPLKLKAKLPRFIKGYLSSYAISLITPGKIGSFSLIYFLDINKEDKIGPTSIVMIIDKAITLGIALILGTIGLIIFLGLDTALKIFGIAALLGISSLIFMISDKLRGLVKKFILRKYAKKFKGFSKTFFYYLKTQKTRILIDFLFTLFILFTGTLMTKSGYLALGYDTPLYYIIFITMIEMVVSFIPISVSGLE